MLLRSDWDAVKIDIMYRCISVHMSRISSAASIIVLLFALPPPLPPPHYLHIIRVNLAKYVANPALQVQLQSTGQEHIIGAFSTGWTTAGVTRSFYKTASLL
jgi:hypothetical protein